METVSDDSLSRILELYRKGVGPVRILKELTSDHHEQVERSPALTRLLSPDLTEEVYGAILNRFLNLHTAWELYASTRFKEHCCFLSDYSRADDAARDLELLGFPSPTIDTTILFEAHLDSFGEAIGGLYVIEGSTLGGALIARQIHTTFGRTLPTTFFSSRGDRRGSRWKETVENIDRVLTTPNLTNEAVSGARKMFDAFSALFSRPL